MWLQLNDSGSWVETTPVGADVSSRTVTGLGLATPVKIKMAAVNAVNSSPHSTVVSATTGDIPGAPSSLRVTPSATSFKATWGSVSAKPAVTGYEYIYRAAGGGWSSGTVSAREATVSGLPSGTGFEFQVRALNAAGPGPWAAAAPFSTTVPKESTPTTPSTPKVVAPGAPGKPSGTAKGSGTKRKLTVRWTAASGSPTGYVLQWSLNKSTWKSRSTTVTTAKIRTKKGKRYYVRVKATNSAGAGQSSATARLRG